MEHSGGNLIEGGCTLWWMEFPQRSFPGQGWGYFIEGEPDLLALFEKGIEIMPYMKGCSLLNTLLFTQKFDCLLKLKHGDRLIRIGSFFKSAYSFNLKIKVLRRRKHFIHEKNLPKLINNFFFFM